jgi:L-ascorbate metabolism protein UlaG (beta-lactamase superfamily)
MSDHFDGRRFVHPWPVDGQQLKDIATFLAAWFGRRGRGGWTDRLKEDLEGPPPPERADARITFVNHATFLLQIDGVNLLTDPVYSLRCAPTQLAGPRRFRPPGVRFDDLPPIDAVLLSHNHYDHLDVPTLSRLKRRFGAPIVAPLGHRAVVERHGLGELVELDWWDSHRVGGLEITLTPAQHFSGRTATDRDRSLWGSFFVAGRRSVYFGGDSGLGPHFAMIRERLGAPDVALLGIGAFRPREFMRPVHMSPEDAVVAARTLGAGLSIPHHYGTFNLGLDGMTEAPDLLEQILGPADPPFLRLEEGHAWVG